MNKKYVKNESEIKYFYNVNKKGTLSYLAHSKTKGLQDIVVPLAEMHVGIQKGGNIKTGKEWLLNTLPGEKELSVRGQNITNVKGTCQGCADACQKFCYAIHGCVQHHNSVMPSVIKNTTLYRHDSSRFESEIIQALSQWKTKPSEQKVFRWHSSGEIENYDYLKMMCRIAAQFPEVHFYTYTKRFKLVEQYLNEFKDFPSNFVMNLSVWESNLKDSGFNMNYLSKVQCFEWKDQMSVYDYNHSIHCRSVIHNKEDEKKGHLNHNMNCKQCGLCWKGKCKGKTIYVYNH